MTVKINSKRCLNRRNGRGMTLVELIVVLAILAILAAGGIGAASGYMKRSIIETNQSNAETIYQTAQTALQQMQKAGGIYSADSKKVVTVNQWVNNLISKGTAYAFVSSNLSKDMNDNAGYYTTRYTDAAGVFTNFDASSAYANESVHMRYVLTYSKSSADSDQSEILKDLLQPYFSDATVFQGTMTLEFDVEKSADAYGSIHLTAKCLSVFYDSRAKDGWAANATGTETDTTVPKRDTSYRTATSLIGYYDGYKGTAVDTVYLPKVQEGIIVKKFTTEYEAVTPSPVPTEDPDPETTTTPTPEPTPVTHTRLTWAATLDRENLVGSQKDVYYKIELKKGDTVLRTLFINEDFLLKEDAVDGSKSRNFDYFTEFPKGGTTVNNHTVTSDTYTAVYSNTVTSSVTKKSIEVIAKVYVASPGDNYRGSSSESIITKIVEMPLRISYVTGELDYRSESDHPAKTPYIEYSLDITGGDTATVLTDEMDKAVITVYPNYFTNNLMKNTNDTTGIIPFKKGKSTDIDQDAAHLVPET